MHKRILRGELVAIVAVACLINVGFPRQAQAMAAAKRAEGFRQKVEQLGVGAEVRVTLNDKQQTLRGTIESFDDSSFGLRARGAGEKQTVRYVNVTLLEFTKTAYRAKGSNSSEPVTARRVAVELGIGSRVQVQTQDGKTFVGMVAKLDEEQLYLNLSASGPMNVSYATIRELKPKGLSAAKKVGIAAIVSGVVLILTVVSLTVKPCN
jgi:small nuclear ribonucleoprotein (snRNP)-like protein